MNSNDREEFGRMKSDIITVKQDVQEIKTDLKTFIKTVPCTYATKSELEQVRKEAKNTVDWGQRILQIIAFAIIVGLTIIGLVN